MKISDMFHKEYSRILNGTKKILKLTYNSLFLNKYHLTSLEEAWRNIRIHPYTELDLTPLNLSPEERRYRPVPKENIAKPKVWYVKRKKVDLKKEYELGKLEFVIIAYSARDKNGDYLYSMKELRGKALNDYELRKIASELNLQFRRSRISEQEKQHIIEVYNNLILHGKRVTNKELEKLLHRNIKTIYRVLNSSQEINWKKKKIQQISQKQQAPQVAQTVNPIKPQEDLEKKLQFPTPPLVINPKIQGTA